MKKVIIVRLKVVTFKVVSKKNTYFFILVYNTSVLHFQPYIIKAALKNPM